MSITKQTKPLGRFSCIALLVSLLTIATVSPPAEARTIRERINGIIQTIWPRAPKSRPAGRKGPEFILSPGTWGADRRCQPVCEVWTLRPALLYQVLGNSNSAPDRIEVIEDGTKKQVHLESIRDRSYSRIALPKDLEPGKVYTIRQLKQQDRVQPPTPKQMQDLKLIQIGSDYFTVIDASVTFKIMPNGQPRQAIAQALAKIDQTSSPDQRLEARLKYLIQQELWSDFLHELSQVANTPEDWDEMRAMTVKCWQQQLTQPSQPAASQSANGSEAAPSSSPRVCPKFSK